MHEAGHALGLANFSYLKLAEGSIAEWLYHWIAFALGLDQDQQPYTVAHPTIPDSVMNYDYDDDEGNPYVRHPNASTIDENTEPDCSPHPFDVMAIFALYQNIESLSP